MSEDMCTFSSLLAASYQFNQCLSATCLLWSVAEQEWCIVCRDILVSVPSLEAPLSVCLSCGEKVEL